MSERIVRVWIEDGCISCRLCQDTAPDVFLVEGDAVCVLQPGANQHFVDQADDIRDAARDCPVEVIKFEVQ